MMQQKILIIVGPTASGKSALAVDLAKKFNGEIISADSRQVYRRLDIGTGKITKSEMRGVPHHLLDVASPKTSYSAGKYVQAASRVIGEIAKRGKLPIIVGGTGFYIDALVGRIPLHEIPRDLKLRTQLDKKNTVQLFAQLKKRDPVRAQQMDTLSERNNKVRLIRALEIAAARHAPKKLQRTVLSSFDALWLGVAPPFQVLEKNIKKRLHERIRRGMVAEGRRLRKSGLSFRRMEELGLEYRALARLLQNKLTREEFEKQLQIEIRRYAKHQQAYWKRNTDITWFLPSNHTAIYRTIGDWLKKKKL